MVLVFFRVVVVEMNRVSLLMDRRKFSGADGHFEVVHGFVFASTSHFFVNARHGMPDRVSWQNVGGIHIHDNVLHVSGLCGGGGGGGSTAAAGQRVHVHVHFTTKLDFS